MYMIKAFNDYVWGGDPEQQTGSQNDEPGLELSTDDVEDEWTLVTGKETVPDLISCAPPEIDRHGDDDDEAAFSVVAGKETVPDLINCAPSEIDSHGDDEDDEAAFSVVTGKETVSDLINCAPSEIDSDNHDEDDEAAFSVLTAEETVPDLINCALSEIDSDGDDGEEAAFSVVTEFGSNWVVAPPACFSGGVSPGDSVTLITSRENLLLEHPSLSFYTSQRAGVRSNSAALPRLAAVADAAEESGGLCGVADATAPVKTGDHSEKPPMWLIKEQMRSFLTENREMMERKRKLMFVRQDELNSCYVDRRGNVESHQLSLRELTDLLKGNEHEVHHVISCQRAFDDLRVGQQAETTFRRRSVVPGRRAIARVNRRQRNDVKNKAMSMRRSGVRCTSRHV